MNRYRRLSLLCLLLLLTACVGQPAAPAPVATPAPEETVPAVAMAPTEIVAPTEIATEATIVPTPPAAAETPPDWTQTVTVEGDLYVLGNPAAPIRFIDYSDFL